MLPRIVGAGLVIAHCGNTIGRSGAMFMHANGCAGLQQGHKLFDESQAAIISACVPTPGPLLHHADSRRMFRDSHHQMHLMRASSCGVPLELACMSTPAPGCAAVAVRPLAHHHSDHFAGASDCASCCGVLLELARTIITDPGVPLAAPLVFLLNGGEETFLQVAPCLYTLL